MAAGPHTHAPEYSSQLRVNSTNSTDSKAGLSHKVGRQRRHPLFSAETGLQMEAWAGMFAKTRRLLEADLSPCSGSRFLCFQCLGLVALGSCLCCRKSGRKTDRNSSCSWTYLPPEASMMKRAQQYKASHQHSLATSPSSPSLVSLKPRNASTSNLFRSLRLTPTRLLEHGSALGQSRINALPSLQPFAKISSNKPGQQCPGPRTQA